MGKSVNKSDNDDRELTDYELARMRPSSEVLRPELYAALTRRKPGQRGLGKKPAKVQTSIRLDPDVIATFKSAGPNWQQDINAVLLREVTKRKRAAAKPP